MQKRDEIQARINAMVKELHAIAELVDARIDSEQEGLTAVEELEIWRLEHDIQELRKSLGT